jgi:hypothetical protein
MRQAPLAIQQMAVYLRAVAPSAAWSAAFRRPCFRRVWRASLMIPEPDLSSNISVSSRSSASAIPGEAWTRLCPAGHPFLNADFLSIVERHGAAAPESGWTARHLVASDESGAVVGLLPLYIKSHSHGDFIYDWSWAAAYRQLGRQYYPKLMSCLPHTPVAGTRLLVAEGPHSAAIRQALVEAAKALANRCAASSWHVALATEAETDLLRSDGAADQSRRPVSLARSRLRRLRRLSGHLQCGQAPQGPRRTPTGRGERAHDRDTARGSDRRRRMAVAARTLRQHFRPVRQSRRLLGRLFRRSGGGLGSSNGHLHRP